MNLSELSKKKYIWWYYRAGDGMVHKERMPVIYANHACVYYKPSRADVLMSCRTCDVIDDAGQLMRRMPDLLFDTYCNTKIYSWWEVDITDFQKNAKEIKRQAEIKKWRNVVEYRKTDYMKALKKLEELEKEGSQEEQS